MTFRDVRSAVWGPVSLRPNFWDLAALLLLVGAMVLVVYGGEQTTVPLSELERTPVSLDPANLPYYALRTTMRMLLAIVCSTVFTFIYATVAAKSRRAEMVLIPMLDILQSVPILGFLTFTVVFFMSLFPGRVLELGYETLIADQEGETRRLLDHCHLPWDEACLSFHTASGAVATPSAQQVRRPLNADSVQRWRRYEAHLAPARAWLEQAGIACD